MSLKTGNIVGKTNGAASSEYKLARVALIVVGAVTAIAVALGLFTPEQADLWNAQIASLIENVVAIATIYIAGRSGIKMAVAWRAEEPTEETVYIADDATMEALHEGKVGIVPGSAKIERVAQPKA